MKLQVAGGIPIIKVIEEFLLSNKIKRIYGILNGTSNYILSKMLSSNKEFKSILIDAQKLGYAESDPTFDKLTAQIQLKSCLYSRL